MPMKTDEDIMERIDYLERCIDKELDKPPGDPIEQWVKCKTFHAMIVALEWVLEQDTPKDQGVMA